MHKFLVFDTETTGIGPRSRLVQLAWQLYYDQNLVEEQNFIIKPYRFVIPQSAARIHGISTEFALEYGVALPRVLRHFLRRLHEADYLVGHNIDFDIRIIDGEFKRLKLHSPLLSKKKICTMKTSADYLKLPTNGTRTKYKNPKLGELYRFLFGEEMQGAHNALADVQATARCFFELQRRGVISI